MTGAVWFTNDITSSKDVSFLVDKLNINYNSTGREKCDRKRFGVQIVKENICIIDKARQRGISLIKCMLKINEKWSQSVQGIKVLLNCFNVN